MSVIRLTHQCDYPGCAQTIEVVGGVFGETRFSEAGWDKRCGGTMAVCPEHIQIGNGELKVALRNAALALPTALRDAVRSL